MGRRCSLLVTFCSTAVLSSGIIWCEWKENWSELQQTSAVVAEIWDITVSLCHKTSLIPIFGTLSWLFSSGHHPVPFIPCWALRLHLSFHDRNAGSGNVMVGDERSQGCRKNVARVLGHGSDAMCSPSGLVVKPALFEGLHRKQLDLLQVVAYLFLPIFWEKKKDVSSVSTWAPRLCKCCAIGG